MKKIYCTGIAGFVASNLAQKLYERGYQFYGCDNLKFGYVKNLGDSIFYSEKSFADLDSEYLNTFDTLVHCATTNIIYAQQHCLETFQNNAAETLRLFERFKGKIIYTSTASVYGNAEVFPTPETVGVYTHGAYDTSKFISELYLKKRGNYTTLRLSNVYGENQHPDHPYSGVIGKMIGAALKNEPIRIYGDGTHTRDFTYCDDVSEAIIRAVEQPSLNDVINIATGIETSSNDLCKMIWRILDKPNKYVREAPRNIDNVYRRCLDISKAERLLGWKPTVTLEDGIKKTIEWQRSLKKDVPANLYPQQNGSNGKNKVPS